MTRLGGLVLSLRSTVIALVVSASSVLVLAGLNAGVFAIPALDPPLAQQPIAVDERVPGRTPTVVAPVVPPQPTPVAAPVQKPPPAPAEPPVAATQPAPAEAPAVATQPMSKHQQPMAQTVNYRTPVRRQPTPADHPPAPPARRPAPVSPPPASAAPATHAKSRTVNTEPCACDGKMRRVPTHWDPPQS
jgi:hypothetical protein